MSNRDAKSVASGCLTAWVGGDFEGARALLHDNVRFVGPLGTTAGADVYMEGLKGFARLVKSVTQHKVFAEGEAVCIIYDLVTAAGTLPTAGWYRVHDGKVSSIRAFFDARPLAPILAQRPK